MARRLRLALALALLSLALGLGSAAPAHAVIAIIDWRPLTNDIQALTPPVLRTSLLAKVNAAMAATDRGDFCPATKLLQAFVNQLGGPDTVGDPQIRTLEADVAAVLGQFPPDPCPGAPIR